jgi:uncharacterized membrane protein YphA (DoxX/SURF4 family)
MSVSAKLRRAPGRLVTGAYIFNSGITKFRADDDTAGALHGMATGTFPFLEKVPPRTFAKGLAAAETALGATLLIPMVPAGVAALGLVTFSGSLITLWWRTPGMHEDNSIRPTMQGTAIAKDVWMLGIGTGLLIDAATSEATLATAETRAEVKASAKAHAHQARRRARRAARRAASKAAAAAAKAPKVLPG